jgi:predicted nuclease with TOPRIM domain
MENFSQRKEEYRKRFEELQGNLKALREKFPVLKEREKEWEVLRDRFERMEQEYSRLMKDDSIPSSGRVGGIKKLMEESVELHEALRSFVKSVESSFLDKE